MSTTPRETERPVALRYHAAFRGVALLIAFGAPIAILVLFAVLPREDGDEVGALLTMAVFAAIGLPLWWETSRFALFVTSEGLDGRSPWRGARFLPWREIDAVSYESVSMWFVVRAGGGRMFRVPLYVSGILEFLERCEQHLPSTALLGAEEGYLVLDRPLAGRPLARGIGRSTPAGAASPTDSPLWDPELDRPMVAPLIAASAHDPSHRRQTAHPPPTSPAISTSRPLDGSGTVVTVPPSRSAGPTGPTPPDDGCPPFETEGPRWLTT